MQERKQDVTHVPAPKELTVQLEKDTHAPNPKEYEQGPSAELRQWDRFGIKESLRNVEERQVVT